MVDCASKVADGVITGKRNAMKTTNASRFKRRSYFGASFACLMTSLVRTKRRVKTAKITVRLTARATYWLKPRNVVAMISKQINAALRTPLTILANQTAQVRRDHRY